MSVVKLTNPVDAIANSIADPLDAAAKEIKQLHDLHDKANQDLKKSGHDLEITMGKDIAQPFTDMITKQYNFADGINKAIAEIASLYSQAAQIVRTAARWLEPVLTPCFDLLQWAVDQLTADIVVRQGQSAVQAIFNDLRNQVNRAGSDAGSFFGDVFHLNFGAALHDAEDEGKALLHIAGDALAMVATLEPLLCQWAEDILQAVNWCFNQVNGVLYGIVDWVFGISDMVGDVAILSDPNSTPEEKALAGTMIGVNVIMDILMFIPGVDIVDLIGKGLFKLGVDFALKEFVDNLIKKAVSTIVEKILGNIVKDLLDKTIQKLAETYGAHIAEQMIKNNLVNSSLNGIKGDLEKSLSAQIQKIMEDYLAKKITLKEALAKIDLTKDMAKFIGEDLVNNKITEEEAKRKLAALPGLMEKYNPDTVKAILNANDLTGSEGKQYIRQDGSISMPAHALSDHVTVPDSQLITDVTTPKSGGQGGKGFSSKFTDQNTAEQAINDAIAQDPDLQKFINDPASRTGNTFVTKPPIDLGRDLGYGYQKVVQRGGSSFTYNKVEHLQKIIIQLGVDSNGKVFIFSTYPSR